MPWKNGGGVTTELYRLPDGEDFFLRLSIAQVAQSGPFSSFPGIDRTLLVLEGNGIRLGSSSFDKVLDQQSGPFEFRGEDEINAELIQGPIRDFNVMVKRGWCRPKVSNLKVLSFKANTFSLLYLLQSNELIVLNEQESANFSAPTNFLLVECHK